MPAVNLKNKNITIKKLDLGNGKYSAELAKEHKEFSKEIYQLIKNAGEYSEWEKRWREI